MAKTKAILNSKKELKKQRKEEFHKAYHFLENHPAFEGEFLSCLDIEVVKVNPLTNCVDDDNSLNTDVRIWLECGKKLYDEELGLDRKIATHDIDLDCGAKTFEKAIIKLAKKVKKHYGRY